ncbi:hypothetical protein BP5796_12382 [Coleophoma crateriformis]|uniref:Major facilitator superfamily (MFS) profile domain-containing protein n=1 Tax=Coleophoma crateriformis TaxID=565419 RepID=A0A3D8Q9C8_9HELO|nr:hypothetical protein BP5796_12382 [Coleophoma crateriformis]
MSEPYNGQSNADGSSSLEKRNLPKNGGAEETRTTSSALHARPSPFPEGGLRAWCVVAGTSFVVFCNFGYANAFGVYQEYYSTHQLRHESESAIAWIGSLQMSLLFGGMLFGGPLFDRYGEKVIWPPTIVYVLTVFMTSLCTKLWHFLLCQGILGGLAMGFGLGPAMAACGHYFRKRRATAMGLTVAGSSVGGVVLPIALSRILYKTSLGFGWSIRIIAFLMLAILVPSCLAIRARLPPRQEQFFIRKAFTEVFFVCIAGSAWCIMMGMYTPFFYLPTYAVEHGMSQTLSSYLIAILNGASFFGRVIPGILAEKMGPLNMLSVAAFGTGILILCWHAITTSAAIIVFSALYGFFSGAIISLISAVFASIPKNPQNIGTYLGMGMSFTGIAALIGPPVNGALATHYKSFGPSIFLSGAFVLVGAFGLLFARHLTGKGLFAKM